MTLQVELDPQTEALLATAAKLSGMEPATYVHKLIVNSLPPYPSGTGRMTHAEFEELTRVLTRDSEKHPILPPEVNDRASYYEDRL